MLVLRSVAAMLTLQTKSRRTGARRAGFRCRPWALILSILALPGGPGLADDTFPKEPAAAQPATRIVSASRDYEAGKFHRFLLGDGYRDLWRAAIEVEVLDLGTFAGGLTPIRRGGGKQTLSLTFQSPAGREWKFRSIDKDPSAVLSEDLRGTFVDTLVQDQVSAAHPLGPMLVDPLIEAVGILSAKHQLVYLPDDERLGQFRKAFGGTLGFMEPKSRAHPPVTPGFEGFHRLIDTVELWERLDEHPEEKVDARALLRARLFDLLINDFDRHKDQWQWARRTGSQLWEPVPEDRDQAFVSYSGPVMSIVRRVQPRLVDFGPRYPSIFGLTWQGRFIDRRHLAEMEWSQWEEAVSSLQTNLTDAVIDAAFLRLPEEYRQITSDHTADALKSRLRRLPEAARHFYRQLAEDVEIHGSDKPEIVTVEPAENSMIRIRVARPNGETIFLRRFDPRETKTARLYLKGQDDRVVRLPGTRAIDLRVIGGKGDDELDDSQSGGTHFYDTQGDNKVLAGRGTSQDQRPYTHPLEAGNPSRDWGRQTQFTPRLSAGGDLGLFLGGAIRQTRYAFRHHPYAGSHTLSGGVATNLEGFRGEYLGEFVRENRMARTLLHARATEIDLVRFYGFGNETKSDSPEEFFLIQQRQFSVSPQYQFSFGNLDLAVGAMAQYTSEPPRNSLAAATRPYGFGGFGKLGPRIDLNLGPKDQGIGRSSAARLQLGGSWFPKAWSVEESFGEIHGEAKTFLRAPIALRPTLSLSTGGKKVFGRYPFQEAAYLGGSDTLRGLRPQRYAGDASIYGSAELRLRLGRGKLLVPADFGVFGLADAGRVFVAGETSNRWHHGLGGGLWLAVLRPQNTMSLAAAKSEGVTRLYFRAGLGF